jgi:hypothetical protein
MAWIVRFVVVAVVLAAFAAPALAQSQDDNAIPAGEEITVSGGGWLADSEVTISGPCIDEAPAQTDGTGNFTTSLTIRQDAAGGECRIAIEGQGQDNEPRTVEQVITVAAGEAGQESPSPEASPDESPSPEQSPSPDASPSPTASVEASPSPDATAIADDPAQPGDGSGELAETGLDVVPGASLSAALILFGVGLLLLEPRRA